MLYPKFYHFDISILVVFLTPVLILTACNTTRVTSSEQVVSPNTPQTNVPTATPQEVIPPVSPVEEVISMDTATVEAPSVLRPTRTVHPEQLAGYIANPYMGWQDTLREGKRFTETVAYRRINWDEANPADGVYDWKRIESLRKNMAQPGETISFRIRTAQPPPWGSGHTMPDWLVKQGAVFTDSSSDILEGVASTEPLYSGCLYLEAHAKFIEAMRLRYDGDEQVAFIDIGSYGNYGEWDSEQHNDEPDSLDWHARRRIIDMYLGGQGPRPCLESNGQITQVEYDYTGFQETQLIMPYTPWAADSVEYALSRRADIGIRHDALGSERHQNKYREEIGDLVQQRWPHAPIIFEYYPESYTSEALRSARDFATEMHASFIHENFDGRGNNDLIEELLQRVGYRLVLQEITYTSELRPGEMLAFDMTWENTGMAPPYFKTYPLVVSLTNSQGNSFEHQLTPDIRNWLPEKPVYLLDRFQLPANFPAGTYDLRVAFIDPDTKMPALALSMPGKDNQGRYLVGLVEVLP